MFLDMTGHLFLWQRHIVPSGWHCLPQLLLQHWCWLGQSATVVQEFVQVVFTLSVTEGHTLAFLHLFRHAMWTFACP